MSEMTSYQYMIIRYMHDTATHEFLNIGVIMYCKELNYFKANISNRYGRITDTFPTADGKVYHRYIQTLNNRIEKLSKKFEVQQLDWTDYSWSDFETLVRGFIRKDSSFRYSNPSTGITLASKESLDQVFEEMFNIYVMRYIKSTERESRNDDEVFRQVYLTPLQQTSVLSRLTKRTIVTPQDELKYDYSWKNGKVHLIEPVSFDLVVPGSITEKAHRHLGKNMILNQSNEVASLYLCIGAPRQDDKAILKSYNNAKSILTTADFRYDVKLIMEDEAQDFAELFKSKMEHANHPED